MDTPALEQRLSNIETRLSRIEAYIRIPEAAALAIEKSKTATSTPPAKPAASSASSLSDAKPGNWLGIVAIICFVLAAGFIIKLSIESGWLTETRQIGLSALLGFSLMGAGLQLLNTDRSYASLLPGTGVMILYLTTFAAHQYYHLISFGTALALTSAVSGICIWLYTQIRHDIYAITAAAGAYLSPAILGMTPQPDTAFSLYYFLLCSCTFACLSTVVQSRTLTVVAAYLALLMSNAEGVRLGNHTLLACLLAIHFLIFSIGSYYYTSLYKKPLTPREAWSFLPVLLLFYAIEYSLVWRVEPLLAPWLSLGFAAILIGLYLSAKRVFPDRLASQSLIITFTTIVCFHSIYLELLPEEGRPWLCAIIPLLFAFTPSTNIAPAKHNPYKIPLFALLAIVALEYMNIVPQVLGSHGTAWLAVSFATLASFWCALVQKKTVWEAHPSHGKTLLTMAHLLAIVALYQLTDDSGSLAVSASWLCYATLVIAISYRWKDAVIAKSALFVLGFAAAKALLYDVASAPTIVRIVCLLVTGATLYGCGLFIRRISSWNQQ